MTATFELIPLKIQAKGEVISSNAAEFRELVREALASINRDLKTDEDFGQAEADTKSLKAAEEAVKGAKAKALADAEQLHALFSELDETSEEIRVARLDLEGQIKKRKEEVKSELIDEALEAFDIDPMDARRNFLPGLQNAIKGKRTLDSMKTALRVFATTQQAMIRKSRETIERFEKAHGAAMTMDRRELELKSPEAVEAELRRRFEAKKADDERKRLEAEADAAKAEAAKAKADLAEAGKPPAAPKPAGDPENPLAPSPKSAPIPQGQSEAEEWSAVKGQIIAAFAPLKTLKGTLRHSKNEAKLQGLANAINQAWKEWA